MNEVWCVIQTFDDGSEIFNPICDSEETANAWMRRHRNDSRTVVGMCVRRVRVMTATNVETRAFYF